MIAENGDARRIEMLEYLCGLPSEPPWVEFKTNKAVPKDIGEYLSALSNAAALHGQKCAYLVWGIDDRTHNVVGTTFEPCVSKKGNEELESWLSHLLDPRLYFCFRTLYVDGKKVVFLEISAASGKPTAFEGREWIRIGSLRKPLRDYPEVERKLWRLFDHVAFEEQIALDSLSAPEALSLLDYPGYFDLTKTMLPTDQKGILDRMWQDQMLTPESSGTWSITNLGAILFARDLDKFPKLQRKAPRVIVYEGNDRMRTQREQAGKKGYAVAFEGLIDFLTALLPRNEVMGKALHRDVPMYPDLAIRELVANALIHQDFSVSGAGPVIEIFRERIEITNPGIPLIQVDRFLDIPPRSRNEQLARFMRRIGVCEERGSGVDKVVQQIELFQLPAPVWEVVDNFLRVILFSYKSLNAMDKMERVHATYLHACLRYVLRDFMTNSTLRERFGIEPKNSAIASRIIADALAEHKIKPYDEQQSKKNARYLPSWPDLRRDEKG